MIAYNNNISQLASGQLAPTVTPAYKIFEATEDTLIKAVHAANTHTGSADITLRLNESAESDFYYLGSGMLIPTQSALQPVEGFFVLKQGDVIEAINDLAPANSVDVTVSYVTGIPTTYDHAVSHTEKDVYVNVFTADSDCVVKNIHAANNSSIDTDYDVVLMKQGGGTSGYLGKDISVPTQSAFQIIDSSLVLKSGDSLHVLTDQFDDAGTSGALDVLISYFTV